PMSQHGQCHYTKKLKSSLVTQHIRFVYIVGRSGNMIDFEQWYEKEGYGLAFGSDENSDCYFGARDSWNYQQSKIDEINEVANGWKDEYRIMSLRYERSKKRIDDL